jgi:hypothetical protein
MDLEDDLEDDVEDEEIEDLDRVLPPESTTDEAFEEELDERTNLASTGHAPPTVFRRAASRRQPVPLE